MREPTRVGPGARCATGRWAAGRVRTGRWCVAWSAQGVAPVVMRPSAFAAPTALRNAQVADPREEVPDAAAVLRELDGLVGLMQVKATVRELAAYATVQRWRSAAGLRADGLVLHMAFRGNPGTGKTTVARLLGRLLHGLGFLERGHLVEAERADLVGEYVGHTAARTRDLVGRASGGVLFVDEAYSLNRGGDKDFGREATDVLVKAMEDRRSALVVILAGYRDEMDRFLRSNPGLRSRIPLQLDFPDYSLDELLRIADQMLTERQYRACPAARARLRELLAGPLGRAATATGNARLVRNLLERALRHQAMRLVRGGTPADVPSAQGLMELLAADLEGVLRPQDGPIPLVPPGMHA